MIDYHEAAKLDAAEFYEALSVDERLWRAFITLKPIHRQAVVNRLRMAKAVQS